MQISKISIFVLFGKIWTEILQKYCRVFILKINIFQKLFNQVLKHSFALMKVYELSWVLMSIHEHSKALRSTQKHSGVWWNGPMSSHKCSLHHDIMLMSANECSRYQSAILMSVHGYLGLLSSVHGNSWLFMRAHKHSLLMYDTNDQPWALMIMVP